MMIRIIVECRNKKEEMKVLEVLCPNGIEHTIVRH